MPSPRPADRTTRPLQPTHQGALAAEPTSELALPGGCTPRSAPAGHRRIDRISEQANDGHRPNAAGNRGDRLGDIEGLGECDVTNEPRFPRAIRNAVDADVDNDCRA